MLRFTARNAARGGTVLGLLGLCAASPGLLGDMADCPFFAFHAPPDATPGAGATSTATADAPPASVCDGLQHRTVDVAAKPDPGQRTAQGCACESSCGASIDGNFDCDWCYTVGYCGIRGATGYYDFCVYPGNASFDARSAADKDAYFWGRLTANTSRSVYPSIANAVFESIQTTFIDMGDEMPRGRVKAIHGKCPPLSAVSD